LYILRFTPEKWTTAVLHRTQVGATLCVCVCVCVRNGVLVCVGVAVGADAGVCHVVGFIGASGGVDVLCFANKNISVMAR
jgi:hypothetical protein